LPGVLCTRSGIWGVDGSRGELLPQVMRCDAHHLQPALPQSRPLTRRSNAGLCLAVLLPRKLVVLRFEAAGTSYLQITRLYKHSLEHTAANMVVGAFGGAAAGEQS